MFSSIYGSLFSQLPRLLTHRRVIVRGTSMSPTLRPGERVLFHRRPRLDRNCIVLADHPLKRGFYLIKRVVALPGETVEINRGGVLVQGALITGTDLPSSSQVEDVQWRLEPGYYFLLGDNPTSSTDSRQLGPFPLDLIKARAKLVYWPLSSWRILD